MINLKKLCPPPQNTLPTLFHVSVNTITNTSISIGCEGTQIMAGYQYFREYGYAGIPNFTSRHLVGISLVSSQHKKSVIFEICRWQSDKMMNEWTTITKPPSYCNPKGSRHQYSSNWKWNVYIKTLFSLEKLNRPETLTSIHFNAKLHFFQLLTSPSIKQTTPAGTICSRDYDARGVTHKSWYLAELKASRFLNN